jgi:hypothetical protein
MALLTERYADKILGQLSCYDRIVIQGTLPGFCFADGMTSYLYANNIRIFDYPRFAEPLRNELRDNADKIARNNGLQIQFIKSKKNNFRQEKQIKKVLKKRGNHPGLVHIFSSAVIIPGWFIFFLPWKRVLRINPGITKRHTVRILNPLKVNVYIIISISSMRNLAFVMFAYPHGVLFVCRSILTVMVG